LIDERLAPIIKVPDVAMSKVFKEAVKKGTLCIDQDCPFALAKKYVFHHETYDWNNERQFIMEAFKRCGLNLWSQTTSLDLFQQHLDKLESNEVLSAMLKN
jgi:hypothetical protein